MLAVTLPELLFLAHRGDSGAPYDFLELFYLPAALGEFRRPRFADSRIPPGGRIAMGE